MVDEFDNRIKLPPTLVNFDDDVGTTGQSHDTYPAPQTQPRFDHMRLFLIGLLSHQSSPIDDEPLQKRTGTTWMERLATAVKFKYFDGTSFESIAKAIVLEETDLGATAEDILTLDEWFADISAKVFAKSTWSGDSTTNNVTQIPIPASVQTTITGISSQIRPVVYKNGVMFDPRLTVFGSGTPPTVVALQGTAKLNDGDRYTVITEHFDSFINADVDV